MSWTILTTSCAAIGSSPFSYGRYQKPDQSKVAYFVQAAGRIDPGSQCVRHPPECADLRTEDDAFAQMPRTPVARRTRAVFGYHSHDPRNSDIVVSLEPSLHRVPTGIS